MFFFDVKYYNKGDNKLQQGSQCVFEEIPSMAAYAIMYLHEYAQHLPWTSLQTKCFLTQMLVLD